MMDKTFSSNILALNMEVLTTLNARLAVFTVSEVPETAEKASLSWDYETLRGFFVHKLCGFLFKNV